MKSATAPTTNADTRETLAGRGCGGRRDGTVRRRSGELPWLVGRVDRLDVSRREMDLGDHQFRLQPGDRSARVHRLFVGPLKGRHSWCPQAGQYAALPNLAVHSMQKVVTRFVFDAAQGVASPSTGSIRPNRGTERLKFAEERFSGCQTGPSPEVSLKMEGPGVSQHCSCRNTVQAHPDLVSPCTVQLGWVRHLLAGDSSRGAEETRSRDL